MVRGSRERQFPNTDKGELSAFDRSPHLSLAHQPRSGYPPRHIDDPQSAERCRSGRSGRSRKPLWVCAHRGFESHPLRQFRHYHQTCHRALCGNFDEGSSGAVGSSWTVADMSAFRPGPDERGSARLRFAVGKGPEPGHEGRPLGMARGAGRDQKMKGFLDRDGQREGGDQPPRA
jgi:hypothetical protein